MGIINQILSGKVISYKFFKRNWGYIVILLTILIVYISSRYRVQTQLATIISLRDDLNNAKTEKVKASAEYNSNIREPQMRERIDAMNLGLTMPEKSADHQRKSHDAYAMCLLLQTLEAESSPVSFSPYEAPSFSARMPPGFPASSGE